MTDRCAIYSRCSTSVQTVENQIRALKQIAGHKGLTIVGEFSDEGILVRREGTPEKDLMILSRGRSEKTLI